jgi:hypothetical protein
VLWVLVGASVLQFLVDASFSPTRLAAGRSHIADRRPA